MTKEGGLAEELEISQLLVRFKLGLKRHLDVSVSIERLRNDPDYAREQLRLLEERIEDEDLLLRLIAIRTRLFPPPPLPKPAAEPAPVAPPSAESEPPPRYRFGARG
ncbi:MAG: hypothetical protein ACK5TK_13675 [Betaproteobacteria bacterium]